MTLTQVVSPTVAVTPTITSAMLSATDVDNTAAEISYKLITIPATGALRLSGGALAVNGAFTQDDINTNKVTYSFSSADVPITASFTFQLCNGANCTATAPPFTISVTACRNTRRSHPTIELHHRSQGRRPMRYDLVFEGGGARGVIFIGALYEFFAHNHHFGRLVGTSAGAVTAALLAAGYSPGEIDQAISRKQSGAPVMRSFLGRAAPLWPRRNSAERHARLLPRR